MSYRRRRYEEDRYERERDREREREDYDGEREEEGEYERERREVRREGRYRRDRKQEERAVEFATLGLVLLCFVLPFSAKWIALSGGAIFTASAFYQSQRRWRVNPLTWIGGIGMLMVGLLGVQRGDADVPFGLLLPFLIFGGVILGSFVTGEL